MKKTIYILAVIAALTGCNGYFGGFDDSRSEFTQIVFINRSSHKMDISIDGTDWIGPQDTIRLKPENGLFKKTEYTDMYYSFKLYDAVMHLSFDNGARELHCDSDSDFPYNPTAFNQKHISDSKGSYQVVEFSDRICDSMFKHHEDNLKFRMTDIYYPSRIIDSLSVEGSSEAWFTGLFASPSTREKLKLGAVVAGEARSLNEIQFIDECSSVPDLVEVKDSSYQIELPYQVAYNSRYYSAENLRKFSLAHFGCDFAELTGRGDKKMDKFSGILLMDIWNSRREYMRDKEPSEEFSQAYENTQGGVRVVESIIYGDMRILLAEADCSASRLYNYLYYNVFDQKGFYQHELDINYHLITLNADGEFVCRSGGEELALEFNAGFSSPASHPIMFFPDSFGLGDSWIHIPDVDLI